MIPKTLIQALVRHHAEPENAAFFCADKTRAAELSAALLDIVNTPVSPELLPAKNGKIAQKTEELLGPYELHDFFLYYAVRRAFSPAKILFLAQHAFGKKYERSKILDTLIIFYRRFFSQQFKRSCMSDGVSTGSVSLSPRGAWNMPSDSFSSRFDVAAVVQLFDLIDRLCHKILNQAFEFSVFDLSDAFGQMLCFRLDVFAV